MSVGIWTPVLLSTVQVIFPDRLNNFTAKLQTTALAAGTHMRFTLQGCEPVYIHSSAPANDTDGLKGTPITNESEIVLPRVSPIWIYSPHENQVVNIDVGALT